MSMRYFSPCIAVVLVFFSSVAKAVIVDYVVSSTMYFESLFREGDIFWPEGGEVFV